MSSEISGITSKAVGLALDGLALRHQAIASNIANYNSIGYRPIKVDFENTIADLLASQKNSSVLRDGVSGTKFTPSITYGNPIVENAYGSGSELNLVMLNQNAIQYQALIKGLDKYVSTISLAIKEGRR